MKFSLFLLLSLSLLFSKTFVYECQDNKHFIIQMQKDNKVWLFTDKLSLSLQKVHSESGLKYEKEGISYFVKGYTAFLETADTKYTHCTNNHYKAIWEDAKLRGNDFRAIGNEPGWYLEIVEEGTKTLLVTEYGKERYELHLPKPFISQKTRTTRYRIKGFIDILIEGKKCSDSISNKVFESTVSIKLHDKTYKGCGKSLH